MAGKIPQRFIDDLLDRVDIVDVIGARLELRKTGKNHSARCPFHDEKTPSFSVNSDKQFYYCFGCSAGGNALGFIMDYDRVDFPQAIQILADLMGMEVPRENTSDDQHDNRRKELFATLEKADHYYRAQLRQHPDASNAIAYLRERGLSGEIARDFGLGFAPRGWDNLLSLADDDKVQIERLQAAGLVVTNEDNSRTYDRFRHRIMFPIRDGRGRTVAFGGRVLGDDKPKYLNSPETSVFHKGRELYGLYEASRTGNNLENLIIVEGYMDVLALVQFGVNNAVATLGTATSVEHLNKLYRYTSEVVFCFDGDAAGRKAARRALEIALPALTDGRSAKFLFLPDGEDPDTLVRKIGADAFIKLVSGATPLSVYLFDSVEAGLDLELPDNRARLSQLAAPLINKIPHGVFHQLMIDQLAAKTGLASVTLAKLITEEVGEPPPWTTENPADYQSQARPVKRPATALRVGQKIRLTPIQWLIALLTHHAGLALTIDEEQIKKLARLTTPEMDLLIPLIGLLKENPDYSLNHVLGYWRGIYGQEQGEQLARIVNSDLANGPGHTVESDRAQMEDILSSLLEQASRALPIEQQISQLASKRPLSAADHKIAIALWHQLTEENRDPELIIKVKQLVMSKGQAE